MFKYLALISWSVFISASASAYTFREVADAIKDHPAALAAQAKTALVKAQGKAESSWGDPQLSVAAMDYPSRSFLGETTPMTATEISLSQNIPLSSKYSRISQAYQRLGNAVELEAEELQRELAAALWEFAIAKRQLSADLGILKENLAWLGDMRKIAQNLYANGKGSQQGVLELNIRQNQLRALVQNKERELEQIELDLRYLAGEAAANDELDLSSVPWARLEAKLGDSVEANKTELALRERSAFHEEMDSAQRLNFIPDVNVFVSYMKAHGEMAPNTSEFVSAGISFSLPFSQKRGGQRDATKAEKIKADRQLSNYRKNRRKDLAKLELGVQKRKDELELLEGATLAFARSSRDLAAKSYGLGKTAFLELLQAQINYQNLLVKINELQAQRDLLKTSYLLLRGDNLHEF